MIMLTKNKKNQINRKLRIKGLFQKLMIIFDNRIAWILQGY